MFDSLTPDELQRQIDATRREYDRLREQLESALGYQFEQPGGVADRLLSVTDEFGRERALELLTQRPGDYGDRRGDDPAFRDSATGLSGMVDTLVEVHARLDELTRQRGRAVKAPDTGSSRIVNIQGREYAFDPARRELREVSSGQRYQVEMDRVDEPCQTLTQRAAQQSSASKAPTRTEHDRDRDR